MTFSSRRTEREEIDSFSNRFEHPWTEHDIREASRYFMEPVGDIHSFEFYDPAHSRVSSYEFNNGWSGVRELVFVFGYPTPRRDELLGATTTFVFSRLTEAADQRFPRRAQRQHRGIERVDVRDASEHIDTGRFNARRAELFPAYKRFLEANGLQHRL